MRDYEPPPRSPERIVRVGMSLGEDRLPIEFRKSSLKASGSPVGQITGAAPAWVEWTRKGGSTEDEAGVKAVSDFDGSGNPGIEFTSDGLWRIAWETAVAKGSGWDSTPYFDFSTDANSAPPDAHSHTFDKFDLSKAVLAFVGKFELSGSIAIQRLSLYMVVTDALLSDGCLGTSSGPMGVHAEALINLASGTKAGCHLRTGEIIGSRGLTVHDSVTKLIIERIREMTGDAETS